MIKREVHPLVVVEVVFADDEFSVFLNEVNRDDTKTL